MIKFTGIVVTYNEERRLRECLNSLAFCEQLLVIDLGSEDRSVEIAMECGAEIISHEWAPIVEQVWPDVVPLAQHEWILRADPDEVFPTTLSKGLQNLIIDDQLVGLISLPYQYYFCRRPLKTTRWGQVKYISKVFHKDRVCLKPQVHRGISIKDGYKRRRIEAKDNNLIQHYWVDTYAQLFDKHWRYIQQEGESRYKVGERFWPRRWVRETWRALRQNLLEYGGLKGGFVGVFLSFFYAWYVSMSLLSLWRYQRRMERRNILSVSED